jgi:predicted TIM-barrel fold metal-dependent hydrolase
MTRRIDVHNHFFNSRYLQEMDLAGILGDIDGFPLPAFSPETTIEVMDRYNITSAMLSVSSPGTVFAKAAVAVELARAMNEECAALITQYTGRFGGFAIVPLPDIDASLKEIAYTLDVLKLDGVGLLTNYSGRYLSDIEFLPVFEELNRRKAVVFIHPTQPPGFGPLSQGLPAPMLEYPFDTTRMVAGLIKNGILRRFEDIKIIICHGGGVIPYLTQRMTPLLAMFSQIEPHLDVAEVTAQLKSLYYDLTATASAGTIAALKLFVPDDHLLYGTDFPFMPEMSIPLQEKFLTSDNFFSESARQQFFETTPLALFPQLA